MGSKNSKIKPGNHETVPEGNHWKHNQDNSTSKENIRKFPTIEEEPDYTTQTDMQGYAKILPNGDINHEERGFLGDTEKRQSTLSSSKPESEVSIVISNPSDDDSESIKYTVPDHDIHNTSSIDDDRVDKKVTEKQNSSDNNMGNKASVANGEPKIIKESHKNSKIENGYKSPKSKQKTKQDENSNGKKKTSTTKPPKSAVNGDVAEESRSPDSPQKRNSINGGRSKSPGVETSEKRVRINSQDPIKDADDFYTRLAMRVERCGYLKEEPCLELFEKIFNEYLEMKCKPPKDEDGIVVPSPPLTKKADLLKSTDFMAIDLHASKVPQKMLSKTLEEMVQYLLKPAGSNVIEKVRALFVWLVTIDITISDDVVVYEDDNAEAEDIGGKTVDDVFQEIQESRLTHASVFDSMCKLAGIKCRSISGISRGFVEQPSTVVTETVAATWSAVVIDDSWRLINVGRAASIHTVLKNTDKDDGLTMIEKRESPITDMLDFYFMTDPEVFVFSHLPDDDKFQLMPRPVSYAEFTYLPYLKPHYFILGFRELKNYDSVLDTDDGTVELAWSVPKDTPRRIACKFHRIDENAPASDSHRMELRDFVFLESDMKEHSFRAKVHLPSAGTYVLEIYGRDGRLAHNKNSGVCSYVIQCSRNHTREPYIENDREEWGPGSDCLLSGLIPVSYPCGEIRLTEGKGLVEFDMNNLLEFVHTLSHPSMDPTELANYVVHWIDGGKLFIHIRVPKTGEYALKIYSRKESDTGVFVNTCTYLVTASDDVPRDLLPFPKVDDGLVGSNRFFRKLNMEVVSPKNCIVYSPPSGVMKIKINLAPNVHYLPEFKFCRGNNETPMHEYTTWSLSVLQGTFRLRFPQQGMYLFSLYAILPDQDDQVNVVYNVVIICNWPSERCFPYPSSLASWTPHYRLHAPKEVYLISESEVKFLADIPDASKVFLKGKSGWQLLEKREDGLWENNLRIEPGQENMPIKMFAAIEEGSDSYFSLLQFKVISREEMEEMEEQQRNYYRNAVERVDVLKKTGRWQEPEVTIDDDESLVVSDVANSEESKSDETGKAERKKKSKSRSKKSKVQPKKEQVQVKAKKARKPPRKKVKEPVEESSSDLDDEDTSSSESESSEESEDEEEIRLREEERKTRMEKARKKKQRQRRDFKEQLIINRLKGAIRRWDKLELIRALDEWKEEGFKEKKHYRRGLRMLEIITLRDDLITHLDNRNLPRLKNTLDEVVQKGYANEIPYEVSKARARIGAADSYVVVHHHYSTIDIQTLAEIRSYVRPPQVVHQIVVAMLLLMGTPEKNTKTWKRCKKRLKVFGRNGLNQRLHEIEPEEIHESIAARTNEMLSGHTTMEADAVSPGVGALFCWVTQITEAVLEENSEKNRFVRPAHKKQQQRLLREDTEISIDWTTVRPETDGTKTYVLREKTQSHFRTKDRGRRDTKKGLTLTLDTEGSRNRSRSRNKPNQREKTKTNASREQSREKKEKLPKK